MTRVNNIRSPETCQFRFPFGRGFFWFGSEVGDEKRGRPETETAAVDVVVVVDVVRLDVLSVPNYLC